MWRILCIMYYGVFSGPGPNQHARGQMLPSFRRPNGLGEILGTG